VFGGIISQESPLFAAITGRSAARMLVEFIITEAPISGSFIIRLLLLHVTADGLSYGQADSVTLSL
jgi:hypothetical protein